MSLSNSTKQQAVALKYQMENNAPIVVASGMGNVAQKIIDVAMENGVPIFEDDSLAALLAQLQVGREIPPELFQAIVDIYVYFLNFTLKDKPATSTPAKQPASQGGKENATQNKNEPTGIENSFISFDEAGDDEEDSFSPF